MALEQGHVLFLCVANSARSQMAEGLARSLLPASVKVSSAGSCPGSLNPLAVQALQEIGLDISSHHSKGLEAVELASVSMVITLCAEEVCPVVPSGVAKLHWSLPDPAASQGSNEDKMAQFRAVRDEIQRRITALKKGNAE